jgi:DNA polymerase-1
MKKIIMVDGNNLVFRSYYATAYSGNFMKNSKGFPTNALLGFVNMINKIIVEEKPMYMIVAFDKGKTFRHEKYDFYKGGRSETPDELKVQFPKAKELLEAMGIKYYEIDNYEADDIIGTFAKYCDLDDDYDGTIISSDKDLLQLISDHVDIKLLKQKDYIRYNLESFRKDYGIEPINIIDLKALMGDASDNIPGVKGIGEKTALKLLQEYRTLDGVYQNTDKCTPSVKKKLESDKDNAYMSYEIATIYRDVPMEINISDIKYLGPNNAKLNALYEEFEFYSLLRKNKNKEVEVKKTDIKIVNSIDEIMIDKDVAVYLELSSSNYHKADIIGMSVYNEDISYFIPYNVLKDSPSFLTSINKYTYDLKKTYTALKWKDISFSKCDFDLMIGAYLLEYNVKDDIAVLANSLGYDIPFEKQYSKDLENVANVSILKAKFIYEHRKMFLDKLQSEDLMNLFSDLEMPLSLVLADMEYTGFRVDKQILIDMGEDIQIKMDLLEKDIYNHAGETFNLSSPQQLSNILFEKLGLPHGNKKIKNGYSTATDVLEKIKSKHPIVPLVIEYRMLNKLYSSYIEGLIKTIHDDGKIHTIYTQTVARTGRLSSIEPNLQNIPIRYKYGRLIRKAFLPSEDSVILSSDYSQIELRILAHVANITALKEAFINNVDIHTKTASDIFHIGIQEVTDEQRRIAKAVNFGIIYGISGFGLSEQINISTKEAQGFINSYLESYPGIKEYMDKSIEQAKKLGYVKTLFNRKRLIPDINNKNYMIRSSAERMALNTPIQGTSADIIKKAMIDIYNEFKKQKIKSKMLVQVHDELVLDCKKEELEKVTEIVKNVMENVYKLDLPLDVHIDYGDDWYQAK